MLYIGGTFATPIMGLFTIFKPRHRYRPSHWLTAITYLEHELQVIINSSSPGGNDKERKLLVTETLLLFLKKEAYLLKKESEGDAFLPLRLTWKEMNLLDDLWWGPRRLSEEELGQVRGGPGAKKFHQKLFRENPELHRKLFRIDPGH